MRFDLVGLGSAIVDFAPANTGAPLSRVQSFVPSAGGAVSNVLVGASRLSLRTGFLGCVGDDEFGTFILRDFEHEGVDVSRVKRVRGRNTGLAFYSVDEKGERHYTFYRFPGYSDPEAAFRPEDIEAEYIARSSRLHLSESMLRSGQTRETVFKALQIAKENKVSVSYDPNVRMRLWSDNKEFLEVQRRALGFTDVFLATLEEAKLIVGGKTAEEIVKKTLGLGPSTVVIREEEHYLAATQDQSLRIPTFKVKAADTSGAGDAFDAGFLTGLTKGWSLDKAVLLGGAVAAMKVMKVGTRAGLPRIEEALSFIGEHARNRQ